MVESIIGKYLMDRGLKFDGFCTTSGKKETIRYGEHPVYEFDDLKGDIENIGFIVTMQDENFKRIKPDLDRHHCSYYRDGVLEADFAYKMGYRGASWYIGKIR